MGNRDKNFQLSPPGRLLAICFHTARWLWGRGTEETYRIMLYIQDAQLRVKKKNLTRCIRSETVFAGHPCPVCVLHTYV